MSTSTKLGGLPITAGEVLLDRYKVERLIGEGGTGVVLEAVDLEERGKTKRVAIKLLRSALASDEVRTRFEREARAINTIESEHVVVVHDAGTMADGAPYMVMEHLEGRDLARVLKEDGPLSIESAVDCMLQVCAALAVAHAKGIIHRDLKPANLFLTRRADGVPQVKIVDFGISKITDKRVLHSGDSFSAVEVTSAFAALGSPRYMAPEQVRDSKTVDRRADLWSVGAVLYQLLTGKHAFPAESSVQASVAVLSHDPASLTEHRKDVPPGLEAVVHRCLTRDVDARFQTAEELADALAPFASARARGSLARLRGAAPAVELPGSRQAPTEPRLRASGAPPSPAGPPPPAAPPPGRAAPGPARDRPSLAFPILTAAILVFLFGSIAVARLGSGATAPGATRSVVPPAASTSATKLDAGRGEP